eukprot:3400734-Rhodomonas_salina.1
MVPLVDQSPATIGKHSRSNSYQLGPVPGVPTRVCIGIPTGPYPYTVGVVRRPCSAGLSAFDPDQI